MISPVPPSCGDSFIGISLDSKLFSREWIRYAIQYVLSRHELLLFLIADDLLRYTRSAKTNLDNIEIIPPQTSDYVEKRYAEYRKFLFSEIDKLPPEARPRVGVSRWSDFTDKKYVHLLRNLYIAYAMVPAFQEAIKETARLHILKAIKRPDPIHLFDTSCQLIIDEIAMCLRISEVDGFHYEYYPAGQIGPLESLYSGKFAASGLSVERLVNHNPRRQFSVLQIPLT